MLNHKKQLCVFKVKILKMNLNCYICFHVLVSFDYHSGELTILQYLKMLSLHHNFYGYRAAITNKPRKYHFYCG